MSAKVNKARVVVWTEEQIAKAVGFTAVSFWGYPVGYIIEKASSLEEARKHKTRMLAENKVSNYGRGVIIYAITSDNLTVMVE